MDSRERRVNYAFNRDGLILHSIIVSRKQGNLENIILTPITSMSTVRLVIPLYATHCDNINTTCCLLWCRSRAVPCAHIGRCLLYTANLRKVVLLIGKWAIDIEAIRIKDVVLKNPLFPAGGYWLRNWMALIELHAAHWEHMEQRAIDINM